MCEAFNREILKHREKPIITLLEGIKHYITKRMTSQKELLHGYTRSICPRIQFVIEKNKKQAQGWSPTWHGDDVLSIFGVTNGIETYCIDLKKEACSCRKWDLSGLPYYHVIACIWNIKKQLKEYVTACYRSVLFCFSILDLFCLWTFILFCLGSTFMDTYSNIVYPTNGP